MNAPYTVNSWDVCAMGNERLRNRDEFILIAPVYRGISAPEVLDGLWADIQCCERGDWFSYDAARAMVRAWIDSELVPLMSDARRNPFADIEASEDGEDYVSLYLYVQAPCEVPVY
jgi:hypothetical protein